MKFVAQEFILSFRVLRENGEKKRKETNLCTNKLQYYLDKTNRIINSNNFKKGKKNIRLEGALIKAVLEYYKFQFV